MTTNRLIVVACRYTFTNNVPNVTILKFFAPDELKELWFKPGLKNLPMQLKMKIRTWKDWLMRNPEDELKFDTDTLLQEMSTRAHALNVRTQGQSTSNSPKDLRSASFDGSPAHWKNWKRSALNTS